MFRPSLRYFVQHLEPRALVLKGDWGVGKTFYWRRKIVPEFFVRSTLRRQQRGYAYASLFGVETIQQLKNALAYSYVENDAPSISARSLQKLKKLWRNLVKLFNRAIADEVDVGPKGVGIRVRANSLLNDFAFLSIRNALVCIDDLERRNKNLSINDVFGLVSYLVDQRTCRVLLILNYDALSDEEKSDWNKGKDKAFEAELTFRPTLAQSIEIGLKGTELERWHPTVKERITQLAISNVRIVYRVQRFVRQLVDEVTRSSECPELSAETDLNLVSAAVLLSAAHASRGAGAPDIFELTKGGVSLALTEEEKAPQSDGEKDWREKIRGYGMHFGDSLDRALAHSIVDGFPRLDLLAPALREYELNKEQRDKEAKFQAAWNLYHNTFKSNDSEVYEAFADAIPGIIATERSLNIEPTGRILRTLGHPEAATAMFEQWVALRKGRRALLNDHFHTVTDSEFAGIVNAALALAPLPTVPLTEALKQLDSQSWGEEAINALAAASPEQISEVLLSVDRDWRQCVQRLVSYPAHGEEGKKASRTFILALKLLAESSELAADRVHNKTQGLDLDARLMALGA